MMRLRTLLMAGCLSLAVRGPGQAAPPGALVTHLNEVLLRAANGHSPSPEQLEAVNSSAASADGASLREALPSLQKILESPDAAVRSFGLSLLVQLEVPSAIPDPQPPAPAPDGAATVSAAFSAVDALPAAFKPDVQKALTPAIAQIAARLTDEAAPNRALAATVLGGFTPSPPASIYPPLLAFLKRDDATGTTGLAVVNDLLQLGPLSETTSAALIRFVNRSDQTADSRSNLIDALSTHQIQSQTVNKALLRFLDADDPGVRARLILSLPQLDLAPDVYAEAHSRVTTLATANQDSLQVVNAARAVATCWTSVRMASGCPVY